MAVVTLKRPVEDVPMRHEATKSREIPIASHDRRDGKGHGDASKGAKPVVSGTEPQASGTRCLLGDVRHVVHRWSRRGRAKRPAPVSPRCSAGYAADMVAAAARGGDEAWTATSGRRAGLVILLYKS